jgi:polyisoprenoid-binding protein YceI
MTQDTKWVVDPGHSKLQFKVKHLAIANVTGSFNVFSGSLQGGEDEFDAGRVEFAADTTSLDTNNSDRDEHLRSKLFLDAANYPNITFKGVLKRFAANHQLIGDLTILTTTKPVTFDVEHTGTGIGRFNDTRAGFELRGTINRKDFGLNFHLLTDAGSLVVGEEIRIQGDIELIKQ